MAILVVLVALAACALAQEPIASGRYLVFAQPASSGSPELFWDASGGTPPTPGITPIIAQFLDALPPSTTNQQWMANFLGGLGGSSGLYTFSSALGSLDGFGLTTSNGAVVSLIPTLFNVTSASQTGSGLVTIQVLNSNLALTSNNVPTEQITAQPLVPGNALQLWSFDAIGA
ncbi:hypothetical protein AURDEDRAFT_158072 [Auricularia subglabra TFB-10046 SS5]|nr:hypothetical protein AURDEDRAFT_158072 [Auricularia subglabra TFB-10046 SS5]